MRGREKSKCGRTRTPNEPNEDDDMSMTKDITAVDERVSLPDVVLEKWPLFLRSYPMAIVDDRGVCLCNKNALKIHFIILLRKILYDYLYFDHTLSDTICGAIPAVIIPVFMRSMKNYLP